MARRCRLLRRSACLRKKRVGGPSASQGTMATALSASCGGSLHLPTHPFRRRRRLTVRRSGRVRDEAPQRGPLAGRTATGRKSSPSGKGSRHVEVDKALRLLYFRSVVGASWRLGGGATTAPTVTAWNVTALYRLGEQAAPHSAADKVLIVDGNCRLKLLGPGRDRGPRGSQVSRAVKRPVAAYTLCREGRCRRLRRRRPGGSTAGVGGRGRGRRCQSRGSTSGGDAGAAAGAASLPINGLGVTPHLLNPSRVRLQAREAFLTTLLRPGGVGGLFRPSVTDRGHRLG